MKLGIIGDPVDHSRSPQLHRAFLRDAGIDGSYVAIRVPKENAIAVVRRMRMDGYAGINVTTPLKEEVLRACDELNEDARRAQAVNTIVFGRTILGANTDGVGARKALETLLDDEPVALKRIGILGTGATARAILAQLHETDAYTYLWGRSEQKVRDACDRFEADPWPERAPEIVVSTLPPNVRLPHELVASLRAADLVMDVNYGERATLGRLLEREVTDGELMLEAQARASFDLWLSHAAEEPRYGP